LLNTAILFFILGRIASPALKGGLKSRKERIAGEIEFATKMKADAETELGKYESKLEKMEAEMQRIRGEMREQAETERVRVLADATLRREALERDAHQRIAQELAEAKKEATRIAVKQAIAIARDEIQKNITQQDHDKLATDLLGGLELHFKKGRVHS
jgi:F-type H+-transporting ATPase subunit b